MFERYTEKARRTIFFARYEASVVGSPYIETEHLLLGLLRESSGILRQHNMKIDLSKLTSLLRAKPVGPKLSTSVDLPLDNPSKRALAYAADESEQMGHRFIGPEHLLLGLMREEQSGAAKALKEVNAPALAEVRKSVSESRPEEQFGGVLGSESLGVPNFVKFVEEGTGRELSAGLRFGTAPRIGEAVVVSTQEGTMERFRVIDVEWKYDARPLGKDLTLKAIEVRLKRQEPAR